MTLSHLEVAQTFGNNSLPPKPAYGQPSTSAFNFQVILPPMTENNFESKQKISH